MFKSLSTRLFLLSLFAALVSPLAAHGYSGGTGSAVNPFLLANEVDWAEMSETPGDWAKHFKMTQDIDFSGTIDVIGNTTTPFTGTLDGNHFRCWYGAFQGTHSGLFGVISEGAVIKNFGTVYADVSGSTIAGGLVAEMRGGTIEDCYARNTVTASGSAGGLVGTVSGGTIKNCYAAGSVSGQPARSGGLIGVSTGGEVVNSYWDKDTSGQSVSAGGEGFPAGQMVFPFGFFVYAGWGAQWTSDPAGTVNDGYPYQSTSSSNYSGGSGTSSDPYVIAASWDWLKFSSSYELDNKEFIVVADIDLSGLDLNPAGSVTGGISNLFFDGQGHRIRNARIRGDDHCGLFSKVQDSSVIKSLGVENVDVQGGSHVGGLLGYARDIWVDQCYTSGSVAGSQYVGGLVGSNDGSLVGKSFSHAAVWADDFAGGLVGNLTGSLPRIDYCYSTGAVSGTGSNLFALAPPYDWVTRCYWNMETSGQTAGGGEGRTTEAMTYHYAPDTYEFWDFTPSTADWVGGLLSQRNNGYPIPPVFLHFMTRYSGGSGVQSDPYLISDLDDWIQLMASQDDWQAKYFELTADLDFEGHYLSRVGNDDEYFTGVFDGGGHKLSNGNIDLPEEEYVGIFGNVSGDGVLTGKIHDLVVENFSVTGQSYAGILAGEMEGMISNCQVSGQVSAEYNVGGLSGFHEGTVRYSTFRGTVSGSEDRAGGLCGSLYNGKAEGCRVNAIVEGDGNVGGLIGVAYNTEIELCHVDGEVTGRGENTGGLAGRFLATSMQPISRSSSTAAVTGTEKTGGLIGEGQRAAVSNSYSAGSVQGTTRVGGMAGTLKDSQLTYSYSRARVLADGTAGGIMGSSESTTGATVYWDTEATGQNWGNGLNTNQGLSTAQMQWPYADPEKWQSWDFDGVWMHDIWGLSNDGYPQLQDRIFEPSPGYSGGRGTEADPYLIGKAMDWLVLTRTRAHWGNQFQVTSDIDFDGSEVPPLGNASQPLDVFQGKLDGGGHVFRNGTITDKTAPALGLFPVVQGSAVITGFHLEDFGIYGKDNVGGIVGSLSGATVTDCSFTGVVQGGNAIGGIVGLASGESRVEECNSTANVKSSGNNAGGIVGSVLNSKVTGSYALGSVTCDGDGAGGLIGRLDAGGLVDRCFTSGSVQGVRFVGGLVGDLRSSTAKASSASAETTANQYGGGFVGSALQSLIEDCDSDGDVKGHGSSPYCMGGFAGAIGDNSRVSNCSATGDVSGYAATGGFSGDIAVECLIEDCFAEGSVEGGENTGGFVAYVHEEITLNNCHALGDVVGSSFTGGFMGYAMEDVFINDCHAEGSVEGKNNVGGFTGFSGSSNTFTRCHALGAVTGEENTGGFGGVLRNYTEAEDCYALGAVTGEKNTGGFGGNVNDLCTVKDCYATGATEGVTYTGGFAGTIVDNCELSGSYAEGSVDGDSDTGGFVGTFGENSTVKDCYATGGVTGKMSTGGFSGELAYYALVEDCFAEGDVEASGDSTGGFSGMIREYIVLKNSHATGEVRGRDDTGGFAGYLLDDSELEGCHAEGSAEGRKNVGGFSGYSGLENKLRTCFALGAVTGEENTGGFAGTFYQERDLQKCYARGTVTGESNTGGFVGIASDSDFSLCYARGAVTGQTVTGGFAGVVDRDTRVKHCYATGQTSGTVAAGFVASLDSATVTDCYWDKDTTGLSSSAGGEGLSSESMRFPQGKESLVGWDFDTDWRLDFDEENDGYPVFRKEGERYAGGFGTAESPYKLLHASDWARFASNRTDWSRHFELMGDLDFTDQSFTPVGDSTRAFTGVFDGAGHVMRNISLNVDTDSSKGDRLGLFGRVESKGRISNLHVDTLEIVGRHQVGGLVGYLSNGDILDCTVVNAVVEGERHTGGLAGYVDATSLIENSSCHGVVIANDYGAGGIAGYFENSTMRSVWSGGSVNSTFNDAGGLIGFGKSFTLSQGYATSATYAGDRAGGLLGHGEGGTVKYCYVLSRVEAFDPGSQDVGAFIGVSDGCTVSDSYWNIQTTGHSGHASLGARNLDEMSGAGAETNYEGWDFTNVWAMPEDLSYNQGYPYLRGVPADPEGRRWHPADFQRRMRIFKEEADSHSERWQTGSVPMRVAVRGRYLVESGGSYRFEADKPVPECWVPQE